MHLTRIIIDLGNARLFGADTDMNLSGQQWNTGLSVFFVTYGAFAVFVQRYSPDQLPLM